MLFLLQKCYDILAICGFSVKQSWAKYLEKTTRTRKINILFCSFKFSFDPIRRDERGVVVLQLPENFRVGEMAGHNNGDTMENLEDGEISGSDSEPEMHSNNRQQVRI